MPADVISIAPAGSAVTGEMAVAPAIAIDSVEELATGVIFRSPIAGFAYVANLAAGICVCALLGGLLGLAIANVLAGAVFGGLVALLGGVFRKRIPGEVRPLRVEIAAGSVQLHLSRGIRVVLEPGAVASIDAEPPPESTDAPPCWIVIRRAGAEAIRFRARTPSEAGVVATAMCRALGHAAGKPDAVLEAAR